MTAEAQRKSAALSDEIAARTHVAEMLNNTLTNMADPVVIADAGGSVVLTNVAAAKLFGQPIDIGNPQAYRSFERFCPDGVTPLPFEQSPLLRAFRGEVVENFEFSARPLGSDRMSYLVANGRPLRNEAGKLQGAVMVYHDITQTKTAEHELRESERMAHAIIDTALDAFVQIDRTGAITEWSPHAETMFGWPRDEALGRHMADLIFSSEQLAELAVRYRNFIESIERGGSGYRIEIEAVRRNGTPIQVEVSMTALSRNDGYVLNAFFRDLTDKTIAEQQLRQAQKMESIGAADRRHRPRLQQHADGDHRHHRHPRGLGGRPAGNCAAITRLISEAADRGAELTRHLLAFARKQPLEPCETDPNVVLSELQILLRPTLGEHIEIRESLQDGVWPIFVDRGQLEAALVNLAVNARDAMPDGGTLTLETRNVDDRPGLRPALRRGRRRAHT